MDSAPQIVVMTPVKNEAWILERFLAVTSRFADLIIIADQQSPDGSAEICGRYEKVRLIQNPSDSHDESARQVLLIESARKFCPGPKILLALDADEIAAADAMQSPDWQAMLRAPAGTVLYFEKPDLLPGGRRCLRYRDNFPPLGFVDDGIAAHRSQKIHGIRIPVEEHSPRLVLEGIKILHYGTAREKAQLTKNRYYSVLENLAGSNPLHRRRAFYGGGEKRWEQQKTLDSEAAPESWFEGWERTGIEMRATSEDDFYWQDAEVMRAFAKFGARRFWLDEIWNFDWEECRQRALRLGLDGLPDKPVTPPPLHYRMTGKAIDRLRQVVAAFGFARPGRILSNLRTVRGAGWKRRTLEAATRLCSFAAPRAPGPPDEPRSIFVLRNNDIGDLLAITPLFEALKRKFPRAKIIVGAGSWNFDVLKNNPFVDEILPVNAPWHNQRTSPQGLFAALKYIFFSKEVRALAQRRCDIGIDVLGSEFGSMLLMRACIPFRLGVRGYAGGDSAAQRCVIYDEHEHVGRSALRFAELLGATDLPENRPQLFPDSQPGKGDAVVFAPGGGFAEKCWPVENYVELARLLSGRKIILIGGENDRPSAARIAQANAGAKDLVGKLSLRETFAIIAESTLVVCNSSMAMHAAAAFRKPCLVLLGGWFPSATAHATQWGYPETKVLGKEDGRPDIYTPEEIAGLVTAHFSQTP